MTTDRDKLYAEITILTDARNKDTITSAGHRRLAELERQITASQLAEMTCGAEARALGDAEPDRCTRTDDHEVHIGTHYHWRTP